MVHDGIGLAVFECTMWLEFGPTVLSGIFDPATDLSPITFDDRPDHSALSRFNWRGVDCDDVYAFRIWPLL